MDIDGICGHTTVAIVVVKHKRKTITNGTYYFDKISFIDMHYFDIWV